MSLPAWCPNDDVLAVETIEALDVLYTLTTCKLCAMPRQVRVSNARWLRSRVRVNAALPTCALRTTGSPRWETTGNFNIVLGFADVRASPCILPLFDSFFRAVHQILYVYYDSPCHLLLLLQQQYIMHFARNECVFSYLCMYVYIYICTQIDIDMIYIYIIVLYRWTCMSPLPQKNGVSPGVTHSRVIKYSNNIHIFYCTCTTWS